MGRTATRTLRQADSVRSSAAAELQAAFYLF
jgi:hypothetical protein